MINTEVKTILFRLARGELQLFPTKIIQSQAKTYQSSKTKTNLQVKSIFKTTTETILQEVMLVDTMDKQAE
jgi:hypothetical protein